ncbi:hypothetical protein pb186bvf_010913 [Paramecium bursaria]
MICFDCSLQKIHESDPNYEAEFIIKLDSIQNIINLNNRMVQQNMNDIFASYKIQLKFQLNELQLCLQRFIFLSNKIQELYSHFKMFGKLSDKDYLEEYNNSKIGLYDYLCQQNNQVNLIEEQTQKDLQLIIKWTLLEDNDLNDLKINKKDIISKNIEMSTLIQIIGKLDKKIDGELKQYNVAFSYDTNIETINKFILSQENRQFNLQGYDLQNQRFLNKYMRNLILQGREKDYLYYQLKGQLLTYTKDSNYEEELMKIYTKALQLNSTNPCFNNFIGDHYKQQGKYGYAIKEYDKALLCQPQNYQALFNKGYCLQKLGKYDDARKMYQLASKENQNNQNIEFQLAKLDFQLKQYEESKTKINQLVRKFPNFVEYQQYLAQIYEELKLYNVAIKIYQNILNNDKNNFKGNRIYRYNDHLRFQEITITTLIYYEQILHVNQNEENVLVLKGKTLLKLKDYQQSSLIFEKVIQLYPNNIEGYINKGIEQSNLKVQYIRLKDRIIKNQKFIFKLYKIRLNSLKYTQKQHHIIYRLKKNIQKAEQYIDQALIVDDLHYEANYQKGISRNSFQALLYSQQNKYEQSKQVCDNGIAIYPQRPEFYFLKGLCYSKNLQYNQAIDYFNQAIQIDGTFGLAYNNRAFVYYYLQQYNKAIEDFNKSIMLNCDIENSIYNKVIALKMNNQYDEAIEIIHYQLKTKMSNERIANYTQLGVEIQILMGQK